MKTLIKIGRWTLAIILNTIAVALLIIPAIITVIWWIGWGRFEIREIADKYLYD